LPVKNLSQAAEEKIGRAKNLQEKKKVSIPRRNQGPNPNDNPK